MPIDIVHTHAEGTLVYGTERGDGTAAILGSRRHGGCGFKPSRSLGCWFLPHSRDKPARTTVIEEARRRLEDAGFAVTVKINDDARRSVAEAEAERAERAAARAERFTEYATGAAAHSDAAHGRAHDAVVGIPPGQPILVGHHSEGPHRRAIARSDAAMRRAIDESGKAKHWADRAAGAQRRQEQHECVPTTLRRIEALESQRRALQRALDGDTTHFNVANPDTLARVRRLLAEVDEKLDYWRAHIADAEANGTKVWSPGDFSKGDFAQYRDRTWYEVVRVNNKTITIPALIAGATRLVLTVEQCDLDWTDRISYSDITGKATRSELEQILAKPEHK